MTTYWLVANGSKGRDYSDEIFLKYGIAGVGGKGNKKRISQTEPGDIVVLKQGMQKILAAGKVVEREGYHTREGKKWMTYLDGWEIEQYCYIDWKRPDGVDKKGVDVSGLNMMAFCELHQPKHREIANRILETGIPVKSDPEPQEPEELTDEQLQKKLKSARLIEKDIDGVMKVKELANYYYHELNWRDKGKVMEHEVRTFLTIPLLLALGWSEKKLKIELSCEGGKIDIAGFSEDYNPKTGNETCDTIIETKSFQSGLNSASKQAEWYAKNFPNCKKIVATNGFCYKIYSLEKNGKPVPKAYLDLIKPTVKYPLDPNVGGMFDAIKLLMPKKQVPDQSAV